MSALNRPVLDRTVDHHTVVSDTDLSRMGVSRSQRRALVEENILQRVLDGSYRFPGSPNDELARCVAACLRPGGLIVEGPTAGRIWRYRRMPRDGFVYVIAPPASNPSVEPWLKPYRTSMIDSLHVVERPDGIRLTSPARTAVDLTRHLSDSDLLSVIDQVESEGMATSQTMWQVALTWQHRAGPGRAVIPSVLEQRPQHGGVPESHWESRVVAALIERGIRDLRHSAGSTCRAGYPFAWTRRSTASAGVWRSMSIQHISPRKVVAMVATAIWRATQLDGE